MWTARRCPVATCFLREGGTGWLLRGLGEGEQNGPGHQAGFLSFGSFHDVPSLYLQRNTFFYTIWSSSLRF